MTKHFDDNNFIQEVIEASENKPVLVDFFADWCAPCKIQGPVVEEVAQEVGDKAVVGKLDTEIAQETAAKFGIMGIPTLLIFKGRKVVENFIGLQTKETLISAIEKHL